MVIGSGNESVNLPPDEEDKQVENTEKLHPHVDEFFMDEVHVVGWTDVFVNKESEIEQIGYEILYKKYKSVFVAKTKRNMKQGGDLIKEYYD